MIWQLIKYIIKKKKNLKKKKKKEVGSPYGIQGFPTLKFFGENKEKPTDYNSGRTAKDLVTFLFNE